MSFLSLTLMHDIVPGKRTVEDARKFYAETTAAFMVDRPAPYTEGFRFDRLGGDTADRYIADFPGFARPSNRQEKEELGES